MGPEGHMGLYRIQPFLPFLIHVPHVQALPEHHIFLVSLCSKGPLCLEHHFLSLSIKIFLVPLGQTTLSFPQPVSLSSRLSEPQDSCVSSDLYCPTLLPSSELLRVRACAGSSVTLLLLPPWSLQTRGSQ